jgi:hypothetical protein
VTLTARAPLRRCGKRYASEQDALTSKRGLTGQYGAVPCLCQGWHLEQLEKPSAPKRKPPKDDGLTRAVRHLVLERDGWACVCCGQSVIGRRYSLQDRKRRSQGGRRVPSNLITVLGSGTTECHERIDSRRDPQDEAKGYTVRSYDDPAMVPVMYFSPHGSGFTAWLCDSGELIFEAPARSA